MENQTLVLLGEWNATKGNMLNPSYVLSSDRSIQLEEVFNGDLFSRIHRMTNGSLIIEERRKGSMYPKVWEAIQDFSDLEKLLTERIKQIGG